MPVEYDTGVIGQEIDLRQAMTRLQKQMLFKSYRRSHSLINDCFSEGLCIGDSAHPLWSESDTAKVVQHPHGNKNESNDL